MEIVKEKKMKTPKDGMTKMEEKKDKVEETQQVEEGVSDFFSKMADKIKKGFGEACLKKRKEAIKAGKDEREAMAIYFDCLRSEEGGSQGAVVKGTVGIAEKKERSMEELKKIKDMLEMKIKKMEEGLNEKKHKEEEEKQ
jgi:signal recognition particle GTPase